MASLLPPSSFLCLIIFTSAIVLFPSATRAQVFDNGGLQIMTDTLKWSTNTTVDEEYGVVDAQVELEEVEDEDINVEGRSLYWRHSHRSYYISYAALSANRVPCPPRSGRSYYTRNCHGASGPVRPYYRGCSAISRCARRY